MDSTLENKVLTCNHCQMHRKNPPEASFHPWDGPASVRESLHWLCASISGNNVPNYCECPAILALRPTDHSGDFDICNRKISGDIYNSWHPRNSGDWQRQQYFTAKCWKFLDKVWYSLKENCSVPPAPSNILVEGAVQTLKHGIRKMAGEGCFKTRV